MSNHSFSTDGSVRSGDTVLGAQAVRLEGVSLELSGKCIVRDITMSVPRGSFTTIIGPSGSGKTSLLRLASGLWLPSSGNVERFGESVAGPDPRVAFVFQDYGRALLPWRTVRGNVGLALEATQRRRAERYEIVDQLLQMVGLAQHADKYPTQLSGGMQQRVQIARGFAQSPDLLLMDEPFGALDAMTRQLLQDEISTWAREFGTTVMFVTHDLEEAIYLGDQVVALRANPGEIDRVIQVDLDRPRNQLRTRESTEFLTLRHELFELFGGH